MINFWEKMRVNEEAKKHLQNIDSKKEDTYDLLVALSEIEELEIAKVIIKMMAERDRK